MFRKRENYDKLIRDLKRDLENEKDIVAENNKTIKRLSDENKELSKAFTYKEANKLSDCKHSLCRECKYCIQSYYADIIYCAKDIECDRFEIKE